ncbi:MAG: CHAT domain-containing protein [Saprospiraceae bacterium]
MKQSMNLLRLLGVAIILFLFWAFQSTHSIPEAKQAEQLSEELFNKGQYETALIKALEAKTLYKKAKNWEKVVECLESAYSYAYDIPSHDGEPYLRQAIELSNQYLSKNNLTRGIVYKSLGEWYSYNEKYDSSIIALEVAISIFEEKEDWENKAWVVITLASNYYYNSELDKMYGSLIDLEKFAQQKQLTSEFFDAVYSLLGVYYYTTLDIEKAIKYNNRSLQLIENKENKDYSDSLTIAYVYNNQGLNYTEHFNLQRAAFSFSTTLNIYQYLGEPITESIDVHINYSEVLYQLKQHSQSLAILESLKNINENDFSEQQYIIHKRNIYDLFIRNYFVLSELDSAAFYTDKLIKLYKNETSIPPDFFILKGRLLFYQKKYASAEKAIKSITTRYEAEYVDLSKKERFSKYRKISLAYYNLGKTLYEQEKYDEALLSFQKSLAANISDFDITNINEPSSIQNAFVTKDILSALHNKAITLEAINTKESKQQALNTYQLAIEWTETMRQSMAFDASKENLNTFSDIYKNAVSLAAELYQSTNEEEYLEMAFEWSEKEKAVILLENLIGEEGKVATNIPEDLLEREANLKRNLTFFQQKRLELEEEKDSKNYELNEQRFTDANLQLAKLKDTLQTYYKSYFNLEYQSSIATISSIQKDLLLPKQAFIQYVNADSLFYVFVIEKEKSHLITLPKGAKENQLLQDLQANLQQPKKENLSDQEVFVQFTDLAYQGHEKILEPVTKLLSSSVSELIIVPDAGLNYLPFEVLLHEPVASKQVNYITLPYVLKNYQFHYGYSGTLLLENQKQYDRLQTNSQVLAFAPPYKKEEISKNIIAQRGGMSDLRSSNDLLKGTKKEIQAIAKDFDGVFNFSSSATKANFIKQVSDYGILHLAMHGKPSLDNPNNAHLVFSNIENERNKDNLLHHYEITALETKAQLAVLSACETGVGKELEGEGVMSLGRGFMYAGIPSVVMSLWKMNDETTSKLMPLFYNNLAKGMRKDKALHQAKLDYLGNSKYEEAHPFYWAGFVSLGDAQPLKKGNSFFSMKNIGWSILGLLLLFLGFRFISNRTTLV